MNNLELTEGRRQGSDGREDLYEDLNDAIDAASDRDQRTWITQDGKHIAMIVTTEDGELLERVQEAILRPRPPMLPPAMQPGTAAQIRRLAIDAAAGKVAARKVMDRIQHTGQMYAYINALKVLLNLGMADEGTAPRHGSSGDNITYLDELARFIGGWDRMPELGFDVPRIRR